MASSPDRRIEFEQSGAHCALCRELGIRIEIGIPELTPVSLDTTLSTRTEKEWPS